MSKKFFEVMLIDQDTNYVFTSLKKAKEFIKKLDKEERYELSSWFDEELNYYDQLIEWR